MAQAVRDEQAHFELNSGRKIPALGLGTWKAEPHVVQDAVFTAIVNGGYQHIDCAYIYGNQEEVGAGLKAAFDSGIKREDLFITSKLWIKWNSPEKARTNLMTTLNELGLDYLDLYLVHWPIYSTETASQPPKKGDVLPYDIVGTWKVMESFVKEGLVKDIGVSNFSISKIETLLKEATIIPAVLQVEMHPAWRNDKVLAYCKKHNIHVTAYSPLGSSSVDILDDPTVTKIGKKLGKTPAQILLRWSIERGVSTIPKSSSEQRLKQNIDVGDWSIPAEDMQKLSSIHYQVYFLPSLGVMDDKLFLRFDIHVDIYFSYEIPCRPTFSEKLFECKFGDFPLYTILPFDICSRRILLYVSKPQKKTNPGAELFVTSDEDQTKALAEFWDGEV